MKIALVHDYLNEAGGAERVLRVLSEMYPKAPIYTAFVKNGTAKTMFGDRVVYESKWGKILKIGRLYSYLRFLLPWIWRSIDLTEYDLVITSTAGGYIARGFEVGDKTRVIAYCHTPPKWLYGYETPTGAGKRWWGKLFMNVVGPYLRYFDYISAQRVDTWIANSNEVAGRIEKFYRRSAIVVYPPVHHVLKSTTGRPIKKGDYYLLVTRVTGAKGVSEAIAAAKKGGFKLILVGEVVESRLKKVIDQAGSEVEYLGRVSDKELVTLYKNARGFIALARDEDFGMTVVEAMAMGTPVLALYSGGYKETVIDTDNQNTQKSRGPESQRVRTGVFVKDASAESVVAGIGIMEKTKWNHAGIAKWAEQYNRVNFEKKIRGIIDARTT